MRILITPTFERTVKKMHRQQKAALDEAVLPLQVSPMLAKPKSVI